MTAPCVTVTVDPLRVKGNPEALVTIVEFSDFECPFCRKAEPTVVKLIQEFESLPIDPDSKQHF